MKTSSPLYCEHDDYYREVSGHWFGTGAAILGLQGEVASEDFRMIFRGFSPDGIALVQNAGRKTKKSKDGKKQPIGHRPGVEIASSAPKSVSILEAVLDGPESREIRRIEGEALRTGFALLEPHIAWSRSGKEGEFLQPAALTIAIYQHSTSREGDPNLHSHACIANIGTCRDGRTRALYSRLIFQWKMAFGALYRNEMAYLLQRDLGLRLVKTTHGFEVAGVPQRLIREFSKRRAQIEADLIQSGRHSARAAEYAALRTRKPKTKVTLETLRETWIATCRDFGFSPQYAQSLLHQCRIPTLSARELKSHIESVIQEITESQSHFSLREVVRPLAEKLICQGISSTELFTGVEHYLRRSHDIIHLSEVDLEKQYTTRQVLNLETALLTKSDELHSRQTFAVPEEKVQSVLDQYPGVQSRPHQSDALKHILAPGALKTLSGMPGTGKTYVVDAAREAWEREGYRVIGTALAGRAAYELKEKANIPSYTIRQLLNGLEASPADIAKHHARQVGRELLGRSTFKPSPYLLDANTVLVVDETSMLGTAELHALIKHALATKAMGYDRETRTLSIQLEKTEQRTKRVEIPLAKYDHLTLGYAATTHKYQGATVDHAYALMGGSMQSREMTYTQLSRAT